MSLRAALNAIRVAEKSFVAPDLPSGVFQEAPTVWEFLSVELVDGKARQRSTLSVWVSDGQLTLCLNERDSGMSLYAGGDTLEEAVRTLERRLTSDSPEWRKGYTGSSKKKK